MCKFACLASDGTFGKFAESLSKLDVWSAQKRKCTACVRPPLVPAAGMCSPISDASSLQDTIDFQIYCLQVVTGNMLILK